VHQQVGIAPDRAGEVRVGLVRQAEVAAVERRVDRLLHRAQQHGVDLLRVGPVLGGQRNLLELARLRVVADGHADAHGLQVVAQDFLLLRRRAFVHAVQARVLASR
jgi:hypothetical protein